MDLIKKWSPELYNRERLIGALMDQLEHNRNNIHLLESLGHLSVDLLLLCEVFLMQQFSNSCSELFKLINSI